MVEGEELDARVYGLGGYFGIAKATCARDGIVSTGARQALRGQGNLPGMIYVKLRSALSICDTWPAFLVINSSYIPSHCGGRARIWPTVGRDGRAPGLGSVEG